MILRPVARAQQLINTSRLASSAVPPPHFQEDADTSQLKRDVRKAFADPGRSMRQAQPRVAHNAPATATTRSWLRLSPSRMVEHCLHRARSASSNLAPRSNRFNKKATFSGGLLSCSNAAQQGCLKNQRHHIEPEIMRSRLPPADRLEHGLQHFGP